MTAWTECFHYRYFS